MIIKKRPCEKCRRLITPPKQTCGPCVRAARIAAEKKREVSNE